MAATAEEDLVRRYLAEVWNQGDLTAVPRFVGHDFTARHPLSPTPLRGPAGLAEIVHLSRAAHPDLTLTIEELAIRGDRVEVRLTLHATHTGALQGIAPAGRRRHQTGPASYRLVDSHIVHDTAAEDLLGMLLTLGIVLSPTPAPE